MRQGLPMKSLYPLKMPPLKSQKLSINGPQLQAFAFLKDSTERNVPPRDLTRGTVLDVTLKEVATCSSKRLDYLEVAALTSEVNRAPTHLAACRIKAKALAALRKKLHVLLRDELDAALLALASSEMQGT